MKASLNVPSSKASRTQMLWPQDVLVVHIPPAATTAAKGDKDVQSTNGRDRCGRACVRACVCMCVHGIKPLMQVLRSSGSLLRFCWLDMISDIRTIAHLTLGGGGRVSAQLQR